MEDTKKISFWKRPASNKFPGNSMQSPNAKRESPQHLPRHKLSFKEFENHTEDAWDATEDELLKTALAKIAQGSQDQVHAAAQVVIDNHSKKSSSSVLNNAERIPVKSNGENQDLNAALTSASSRKVPGGASRTLTQTTDSAQNTTNNKSGFIESNHNSTDKKEVRRNAPRMILSPPSISGGGSAPKSQSIRMPMSANNQAKENSQLEKFAQMLKSDSIDLDDLRKLSWSGIPSPVRATTWKLLSGYLSANKERRESALTRKRKEYFNFVAQYYPFRDEPMYQTTYHQIHIDIPRTNPLIPLFQQQIVQTVFERLLFVWAIRHPASGYVQGINDLVTPFFVVFLSHEIGDDVEVETYEVSDLPEDTLSNIEADTYWCMGKLLDGIQDNYTFAQPGVQNKVNKLKELTKRVDAELHSHLENEQIEYLQFSFRWMNNLLMREIPLRCTIRLWDTYLAETDGFSDFHLYVCAAFLKEWRKQLLSEKDFQGLMLMIQNVPTHHWADEEVKLLLAEAYRLKYTFADAPKHLPSNR